MRKLRTLTQLPWLPALVAAAALPLLAHCTHSDAATRDVAQAPLRPVRNPPTTPGTEPDRVKLRYFGGPKYPMYVTGERAGDLAPAVASEQGR